MVLGAFCFSVMSLLVKLVGARLPSQEVVFVRAVVSLAMAYLLVRRARPGNWGRRKGLLVVRGLMGFAALSCFFYGIIHLPLADATVIQYTNPVWTAWLGWWLLGEALTAGEAVLSAAGLLGVLLIARPTVLFGGHGAARLDPLAVGVALAGALFSAAAYVSVRRLSRTEHPLIIVFYFTLVTVPAALPGALAGAVMPTVREWLLLAGVGVTALVGQVFLTRGLQKEPAGRATAIGYVQIVFAALWGMIFFRELPDALSLAGAALVLVSVVVLARRRGRPEVRASRPRGVDRRRGLKGTGDRGQGTGDSKRTDSAGSVQKTRTPHSAFRRGAFSRRGVAASEASPGPSPSLFWGRDRRAAPGEGPRGVRGRTCPRA